MRFYHIEIAKSRIIEEFVPKIPNLTMSEEDIKTPRICVSSTIEGCLSAVCWGAESLRKLGKYTVFRVYVLESCDYIEPKTLVEHYGVLDAYATEEYWITSKLKPIESFLIVLNRYELDKIDDYSIVKNLEYEIISESDTGNKVDLTKFVEYTERNFISKVHQFIFYGFLGVEERIYYEYNPYSIENGELIVPTSELFPKKLLYKYLES